MKRFLSILLAVAMTISMVLPVFAYTDTTGDDHEAAIAHLSGLGVINGYEDGSFQPDKIVTRAEMAKLLVVALKLDLGADLLTGESQFDDVATSHWAIGYINVATSYGLIKGDGDGNFRPDDTVSYAEASTMALRALNYTKVVEKDGVWPTNYLNKANELKLFADVEGVKASEGAKRGEVAQILWNMLNTQMWEVVSENENNGLTSAADRKMMTVKFPDYTFVEKLTLEAYSLDIDDGVYEVSLEFAESDAKYLYAENDFYTLVPGTVFEAVILDEKEQDEIVTIFATEDNYLAEGTVYDLADKYENYTATEDATYEYIRLNSAKKSATVAEKVAIKGAESGVVTEIKKTNSSTRIYVDDVLTYTVNDTKLDEVFEKAMIIKNDEKTNVLALAEGDILTKVGTGIYVVTNEVVEGTFDAIYTNETLEDYEVVVEIDGEEYDITTGEVIVEFPVYELDEDGKEEEISVTDYANFYKEDADDNKFLGETAKFYFNAVGDLIKVVFDEIDDTTKTGSFYVVYEDRIWDVSDAEGTVDYVNLLNADGKKAFVINEDLSAEEVALLKVEGSVVYVEFDTDGEIDKVIAIANEVVLPDAEDTDYVIAAATDAYDKDRGYVGSYKVTSSTVVFTVKAILDEDDNETGRYELVVTNGATELDGVEAEDMLIAYEPDSVKASYIFVAGEATSTEKNYGIVDSITTKADITYITISGTKYETESDVSDIKAGDAVIFTIDEDEATIQFTYGKDEIALAAAVADKDDSIITIDLDGNKATTGDSIIVDMDLLVKGEKAITTGPEAYTNIEFEDYRVFVLDVDFDSKDAAFFAGIEEIDLADVSLSKGDGVNINTTYETVVIIRGFDYDM